MQYRRFLNEIPNVVE